MVVSTKRTTSCTESEMRNSGARGKYQRHSDSSVATNLTRESKVNERPQSPLARNFAPIFRGVISERIPKYLSMVVSDPWHMYT